MHEWITRRSSKARKKMRVGEDINLAGPFDPFYLPLLFPIPSFFSPSPPLSCFPPQWKMMRPRVAECTQFIANRASSLSGDRLSRFRVCVTRHKAGRSTLDVEYSAKCPAFNDSSLRLVFWSMLSLFVPLFFRGWIFAR